MYKNNSDQSRLCPAPWQLQGEAYILNYWLSPQFLKQAQPFGLTPSFLGRLVQVMWVRYHASPIGAYDELLILDHPLFRQRRLSTIPKIFVSTESSVQHGQQLWGIPKELASFDWNIQDRQISCKIQHADLQLAIQLEKCNTQRSFIDSHYIPAALLKIQQTWQGKSYQFNPSFRGRLIPLKHASWQSNPSLFPDFNQARFINGFYVPEFELTFPEAEISTLV